jgi:translation initiation factor 3 subunit B
MYWQNNGEYLAVQVDRYTKTKKSTYTGFELFRIKERDIPIEVLELENKNDKIIAFAWEPKGHRFAIIHVMALGLMLASTPCEQPITLAVCPSSQPSRPSKLMLCTGLLLGASLFLLD